MWETIRTFIETNPALASLYSGAIGGSIFYYFRNIFSKIWNRLVALISFKVEMRTLLKDTYLSENLIMFLNSTPCYYNRNYEIPWERSNIVSGYGTSIRKIFGKWVKMERSVTESTIPMSNISLTVYFCWNRKDWLKKLEKEISEITNPDFILVSGEGNSILRRKRSIDTIYTNETIKEDILNDMKSFLKSEDFYQQYSIPYKRNYLFYGKPGTGKTSLIMALASELGRNIRLVSIRNSYRLEDIVRTIYSYAKNSILVFEDIDAQTSIMDSRDLCPKNIVNTADLYAYSWDLQDCVSADVVYEGEAPLPKPDSDDSNKITLSDVLNIFDGLQTVEGAICVFTTNHIEKLDRAFLRKGRMDYIIQIEDLNFERATQMIKDKLNLEPSQYLDKGLEIYRNIRVNPAILQDIWMLDLKGMVSRDITLNRLKTLFNKGVENV